VKACNDEIEALRLKSSKLKKKVHTPALCSLLLRLLNDVSAHAHTQPSSPNPSSFKGKTTCARTNIIKKVRKANDEEKEERSKINALEREVPWLPTATRATSSPPPPSFIRPFCLRWHAALPALRRYRHTTHQHAVVQTTTN
jgi:hypothetical protein